MKRHEHVGSHLIADVLRARPDESASAVLARLEKEKPASVELVLVCAKDGRLEGVVPIQALLHAEAARPVGKLAKHGFPSVTPETDQEKAASLALHYAVDALPVVDARGHALGVMPSQALLQVLRREHVEDLHHLAGIHREEAMARHAIEDPPARRVRHRLPWLLFGLLGSGLATVAMASFESTFERNLAIAFFVPGIVYLADAIGTQSEAIAVRGLSLTHAGIGHLLAGEVRTGMLLGALLGAASFLPILAVFSDLRLAAAVAIAIFAAGTVAAALGLLLPWALEKSGRDPAFGAGPLATVVQDILSVLVYLGVVRMLGA